jgi:hypothetical protein
MQQRRYFVVAEVSKVQDIRTDSRTNRRLRLTREHGFEAAPNDTSHTSEYTTLSRSPVVKLLFSFMRD